MNAKQDQLEFKLFCGNPKTTLKRWAIKKNCMLEFHLKQSGQVKYALCTPGSFVIEVEQNALELLMNAQYQGADIIVMDESCLAPSFFKLSSGLAGAIFQKFSTYGGRLIIVGDFEKFQSKALYSSENGMSILHAMIKWIRSRHEARKKVVVNDFRAELGPPCPSFFTQS